MSVQRAKPSFYAGFLAVAGMTAACGMPVENGLAVPIPLTYSDGLLSASGEALLSRDERCGVNPGDSRPQPALSPRLLLELANPLSVVSDETGTAPQPFRHGQVQLNASQGGISGAARFLLCDVPLLRGGAGEPVPGTDVHGVGCRRRLRRVCRGARAQRGAAAGLT